MKASESKISTQADAAKFDRLLNQYRLEQQIYEWPYISLEDAFGVFGEYQERNRAFSAFFDIYLQITALELDLKIIRDEINREYSGESTDLDKCFSARMNRYISASNSAFRLRAIWDKVMGLMVLLFWPDQYKDFSCARSRLNSFNNIASQWNEHGTQLAEEICGLARAIDDNYRTSEAHGVGRFKKWAFVKQSDEDDPFVELLWSGNEISKHLSRINSILKLASAFRGERTDSEVNVL